MLMEAALLDTAIEAASNPLHFSNGVFDALMILIGF
jgi:hypothetical protein